ncbi:MAG: hypothetical protein A3B70_06210 [Deltaproteobacteria bacterium RIFCSPHIGHO2_02_FULL_40_11]|nr:MAG: hypothetical protein A3B70_06210 [Deltaproteobacteria bacterium RIFCSPHIGHO2_02_FULL_40_11]
MFDFAYHIRALIEDIVQKVPIFSHIEPKKILISTARARGKGFNGIWAELYPMKYENGYYSTRERSGQNIYLYKTDKMKVGRTEILYIIYFYMPRFQNLSSFEKLDTLFHELYHMSPEFDGKLRKMHSKYAFHGPSMKAYDRNIRFWVRYYLRQNPNQLRMRFLDYTFLQLQKKYEKLDLVYIPEPKETVCRMAVSRRKTRRYTKRKK